jgi:hypothetical protein
LHEEGGAVADRTGKVNFKAIEFKKNFTMTESIVKMSGNEGEDPNSKQFSKSRTLQVPTNSQSINPRAEDSHFDRTTNTYLYLPPVSESNK